MAKVKRTLQLELETTADKAQVDSALTEAVLALERALIGFRGTDGAYIRSVSVGSPASG